jgi:5-methylcytosine-specific restriction endonuclease McrA
MQRGRCAYFMHCKNRLGNDFHCDHITPLVLGGTNYPSNLQLTCPTCNLRKGTKPAADFARQIGCLI